MPVSVSTTRVYDIHCQSCKINLQVGLLIISMNS
jgi:hypothetical protein